MGAPRKGGINSVQERGDAGDRKTPPTQITVTTEGGRVLKLWWQLRERNGVDGPAEEMVGSVDGRDCLLLRSGSHTGDQKSGQRIFKHQEAK